jgi:aspartokinase
MSSLYARCRLIKDVDGVYEFDPAATDAHPRRLAQLSYENALEVAGKLIQPKAVAYLEKHRATCEVAALASPTHSYICAGPTRLAEDPSRIREGPLASAVPSWTCGHKKTRKAQSCAGHPNPL